jgi:hypothetical protein
VGVTSDIGTFPPLLAEEIKKTKQVKPKHKSSLSDLSYAPSKTLYGGRKNSFL